VIKVSSSLKFSADSTTGRQLRPEARASMPASPSAGALQFRCYTRGRESSRLGILIVLTILAAVGAYGQKGVTDGSSHSAAGQSNAFIFVSPNTSKGLTLKSAVHKLRGPAEVGLILGARDLFCRLGTTGRLTPVIGSWSDGVENSVLIRVQLDPDGVRYVSSVLGRKAHQKSVLYFRPHADGPATLYVLRTRKQAVDLRSISSVLESSGVEFRTLAPSRNQIAVYIVDTTGGLGERIISAARRLRASISTIKGTGEFIGSEVSANAADQAYSGVIAGFETRHPQVTTPCRTWSKIKGN
jgi:hypothetical protein